ncbi:hypothetical protein K491DRAFT_204278 [Lophiostoma macrostomum CBS 122681]|uniref:Uncharacterized protein n=1 Tax=Lophiostoma macrostomum CBS 122681 TaxID=1314788 RepID=A0A6A6TJW1_9PLEO|nr:hypothetical protein K491DRAFT_204278 [Lophiostoma macrostomum CBS 122681]
MELLPLHAGDHGGHVPKAYLEHDVNRLVPQGRQDLHPILHAQHAAVIILLLRCTLQAMAYRSLVSCSFRPPSPWSIASLDGGGAG